MLNADDRILVDLITQANLLLRYTAEDKTSISWTAKSSSPLSSGVC